MSSPFLRAWSFSFLWAPFFLPEAADPAGRIGEEVCP